MGRADGTNRIRINTLALAARLPSMYPNRAAVEAGGLVSYGPNLPDLYRRAGDYVDKILRGANPAAIPVEQSTKFDLVINLVTAKALALTRAAVAARPRRRGDRMSTRREFITLLGGAAAWPLRGAGAAERAGAAGRPASPRSRGRCEISSRVGAFLQALAQSGWIIGRNVRIDTHWATANADAVRRHAAELAALAPDVILAHGAGPVRALLQATRTVPIVFPIAGDPVGAGLVDSLARPGGNATGFSIYEFSLGGKWLELLKQIAPSVTRTAVLRDTAQGSGTSMFAAIQTAAPSLRVEISPVNMRDAERDRACCRGLRSRLEWRPRL